MFYAYINNLSLSSSFPFLYNVYNVMTDRNRRPSISGDRTVSDSRCFSFFSRKTIKHKIIFLKPKLNRPKRAYAYFFHSIDPLTWYLTTTTTTKILSICETRIGIRVTSRQYIVNCFEKLNFYVLAF